MFRLFTQLLRKRSPTMSFFMKYLQCGRCRLTIFKRAAFSHHHSCRRQCRRPSYLWQRWRPGRAPGTRLCSSPSAPPAPAPHSRRSPAPPGSPSCGTWCRLAPSSHRRSACSAPQTGPAGFSAPVVGCWVHHVCLFFSFYGPRYFYCLWQILWHRNALNLQNDLFTTQFKVGYLVLKIWKDSR